MAIINRCPVSQTCGTVATAIEIRPTVEIDISLVVKNAFQNQILIATSVEITPTNEIIISIVSGFFSILVVTL